MTGARAMRLLLAPACLAGAFAVPTVVLGAGADDGPAAAGGSPASFEAFSVQQPLESIAAPQRTVEIPALRRAAPLPAMKSPRGRSVPRRATGGGRSARRSNRPPVTIATRVRTPSAPARPVVAPRESGPAAAPAPASPAPAPARPAPAPARPAPARPAPARPAPAPSRPAPDDFDELENFDSTE